MPQPLRRPGAPRRTPLAALAAPVAAVGLLAGACANFEPAPVMTVNGTEITQSSLDTELDLIEDSKEYRELLEGQLGAPSAGTGRSRSTVSTEFVANLLSERVYFTLVEDQLDRPVDEDDLRAATDRLAAENNEQFAALDDEPRRRLARRVALLTVLQEEVLPGYFEERKDDFDTLCVSHILVSTEARTPAEASTRVNALAAQLEAGASFDTLASEQSDDATAAQGAGDLGCGGSERFVAAFGGAAGALEVGEVSEPVETEFGFHLIRRDEATYEAAAAEVQQRFLVEQSEDADVEVNARYGRWVTGEAAGGGARIVPPGAETTTSSAGG
ncbi:MAG: peptidylprolyl isomerase [Actinomycetota bacterium]|nr:peptidylprolyl isomerase [Actinomycetota bacterium]